MRESWQRTVALVLALFLAVAGTFLLATRAGRQIRHMNAANEPIRAWMSVPFVAHIHHVPAADLFQAIGVQPHRPHDRRSIRRLAQDLRRPVPEVIAQLQHAIEAAKSSNGPPK